jgi:hypothetical protein
MLIKGLCPGSTCGRLLRERLRDGEDGFSWNRLALGARRRTLMTGILDCTAYQLDFYTICVIYCLSACTLTARFAAA